MVASFRLTARQRTASVEVSSREGEMEPSTGRVSCRTTSFRRGRFG